MKCSYTLFLIILFSSCSSQMTGELEKRHLHNGTEKSGTVVYNPHGVSALVNDRRKDAIHRIYEYCGPSGYSITKEEIVEPRERDPKYNGVADKLNIKTLSFVDFACNIAK